MRDVLTYIGIALIAVLTAALAAPHIVDFDAYRGRFAEELASISGAQVALDGPIELRLLPTPQFSAHDIGVTGDLGSLRAKTAFFELSLPSLIQGRLQISTARLEGADISLAVDKLRNLGANAAAQIDDLALHDARLTLVQPGAPAPSWTFPILQPRRPRWPARSRAAASWRYRARNSVSPSPATCWPRIGCRSRPA